MRERHLFLSLLALATGCQILVRLTDLESWLWGVALAVTGVVGAAVSMPRRMRFAAAATAAVAAAMTSPMLVALMVRWREIPGLGRLLAAVARALGIDAVADGGIVVLHSGALALRYLPDLNRLGAFPVLLTLASLAALCAVLPLRRPLALMGRWFGVVAAWGLLRILFLMLARHDLPEQGLEVSPWLTLATWAPAALLLGRTGGAERAEEAETAASAVSPAAPSRTRLVDLVARERWRAAAALAAGLAWVVVLGWNDPGSPGGGRILFDDAHGAWEPTDTPFDTDRYGQRLAYSYSSFYSLLGWHYEIGRHGSGPLSSAALEAVDVLVVKTPTDPFSPAEIAAVDHFVRRGGGLFLIGDHTNLFGMTEHLNRLAARFGLRFGHDGTFALRDEGQSRWRAPRWLPHPIARRIGELEFETSCTIELPLHARAPIIGYGLGAEPADYSRPGFFGDLHPDLDEPFGAFAQHAILDHGRGRVAAFSDSTTLSNFSLFFPGRAELVLSTVELLGRRPGPSRWLPLVACAVFALASTLLASHRRGAAPGLVVAGLVAGLAAGTAGVRLAGDLPPPEPRVRVPRIVFDRSISDLVIPSVLTVDDSLDPVALDSFLVAAQRVGYWPRLGGRRLRDEMRDTDVIVLFHPKRAPSARELEALRRFVAAGGRLLVVDGLLPGGRHAREVLMPFGLETHVEALTRRAVEVGMEAAGGGTDAAEAAAASAADMSAAGDPETADLGLLRPVLTAWGGRPVLEDEEGRPVFTVRRFGRGFVGLLSDSFAISKTALGSRFTDNPSPRQRANLETAYLVLRRMGESLPLRPVSPAVPAAVARTDPRGDAAEPRLSVHRTLPPTAEAAR